MKPSLDEAYLRVKRARQHITALRAMQRRIGIDPDEIIVTPHSEPVELPASGHRRFHSPEIALPPLPLVDSRWSIRLGETIYNLRAALDYLVYSLAHLDSGHEKKRTQFPICSSSSKFKGAIKAGRLRGVNAYHKTAIEALQPYPGRDFMDGLWLTRLADLSNPDKHRHLTVVQSRNRTIQAWTISATPARNMQTQFAASRVITLGDNDKTPVIPVLDSLRMHVTETLDQFKPDF